MAAEKLLVNHINEMHEKHPEFKMKLLGTSGVSGEGFPMYITQCYFKLPDKEAVEKCAAALKQSDELIRRRVNAAWKWEMAWENNTEIMFFVTWLDTAYFFKNHNIFMGKDHSRFAIDFGLDVKEMDFVHHRVLENGDKEVFEFTDLTGNEKEVLEHLDEIEFSREFKEPRF
ncbi:hypothetical protein WIW50_11580 [Flavobacteriaceae bacterium 3-367]